MIKYILTWAGLMCIFYLLMAFTLWQFNPAMWRDIDRGFLAVMGSFLSGAITALYYDNLKD